MRLPNKPRSGIAASCALAILGASAATAAPLTFAQYIQANGGTQQFNVATTGDATSVTASGAVFFSFSNVLGLPFAGPEPATFTLSATSTQLGHCGVGCGPGDSYVQPGYSGTFSFIDASLHPGADLLSGTFAVTGSPATTGAQFSSSVGSSGGSFNASATLGNLDQLVFTSTYLTFLNATVENASWSLSSLFPDFSTGTVTGGRDAPPGPLFDTSGSGTFSVEVPTVPAAEPVTTSVFIVAVLGLGMVRRLRRT
jgi:hypothetical protein